jgi:glucose/arabinose dehydrogenase
VKSLARILADALAAALVFAVLGSAGCVSRPVTPTQKSGSQATTATAVASATAPAALANLELKLEKRWSGFSAPVYLTAAGDGSGRLFVVEQDGLVKVVADGAVLDTAYLDVRRLVSTGGERGLLGMAFSPGFESNGRLYINYTDRDGTTRIVRYTAPEPASNTPAWGAPEEVLSVPQPYANHNGGNLQFGPDGMLYIGLGDGGSGGDPQKRAQNPRELLGKMLRIDVGESGALPPNGRYSVPADNPFVADSSTRPEIWALGLRNPWRYSFDASGGALWIGDVGQDEWEEIDYAAPGKGGQNWGWNLWEGDHPYPVGAPAPQREGFTFPVLEYPHSEGISVTGGYVYRGSRYPALVGTYLYADFAQGWIGGIRLQAPDGTPRAAPEKRRLLDTATQPSSFGVDESNELFLVDYKGIVWQLAASAK